MNRAYRRRAKARTVMAIRNTDLAHHADVPSGYQRIKLNNASPAIPSTASVPPHNR